MTLIGNIKKAKAWEWVLMVLTIACLVYMFGCLHGCVGAKTVVDTISRRGTEILIGAAIGAAVALAVGVTGIGIVAAPVAAAGAVVFATPECGAVAGNQSPPSNPIVTLEHSLIAAAVLYGLWLFLRRKHVAASIGNAVTSGSMWSSIAHWARAVLGISRPTG